MCESERNSVCGKEIFSPSFLHNNIDVWPPDAKKAKNGYSTFDLKLLLLRVSFIISSTPSTPVVVVVIVVAVAGCDISAVSTIFGVLLSVISTFSEISTANSTVSDFISDSNSNEGVSEGENEDFSGNISSLNISFPANLAMTQWASRWWTVIKGFLYSWASAYKKEKKSEKKKKE